MPEQPDADPAVDPHADPAVAADARLVDDLAAGGAEPPAGDEVARVLAAWRDDVREPALPQLDSRFEDPYAIALIPVPSVDPPGTVRFGEHVDRVAPARREFTADDGATYVRPDPDEFGDYDAVDSRSIVDDGGPD